LASDVDYMLSLTAIGACIENIVIAATEHGLRSQVRFVRSANAAQQESVVPVVRITFNEGAESDPLAPYIESRCTSRRMNGRLPVAESLLTELQACSERFSNVRVHWVEAGRLRELAKLIGLGNRMRFEYEPFHREIYDNLRFTATEAEQTRDGLDIASLQLGPAAVQVLAALGNWRRMKWANLCGFSRCVSRQATSEILQSGAVGLLTVASPEMECFVAGGRVLERIWLSAVRTGLAFHPTASLSVMLEHSRAKKTQLPEYHQRMAANMYQRFRQLFPELASRTLQMAFRLGVGPVPGARTLRLPLQTTID
jgi:hypothetical protein